MFKYIGYLLFYQDTILYLMRCNVGSSNMVQIIITQSKYLLLTLDEQLLHYI